MVPLASLCLVLLSLSVLVHSQPTATTPTVSPSPAPQFFTQTADKVDYLNCNRKDILALTFDDGPHPNFTMPLLDTLKSLNVTATFFLLGFRAVARPDIVQRIWNDGHQIAHHTWDHPELILLNRSEVISQMQRTETVLSNITNHIPTIMRPPFGESNNETIEIMHSLNYDIVTWNLDTRDWQNVSSILGFQQYLKPGYERGYISLQHDIQELSVTPDRVKEIVSLARERGFQFVSIADCIGKQPYRDGWGNVKEPVKITSKPNGATRGGVKILLMVVCFMLVFA
ncbi:hypothetical protein HK098_000430 [Nowakowskiella sp. JEL0407]|nr:hypothetical protein HK098_000430 [Nowakowskiella sp. JEL0407]